MQATYMSVTRILFSQNGDGCVDYVVKSLYTIVELGVATNFSEFTDICNIVSDRSAFKNIVLDFLKRSIMMNTIRYYVTTSKPYGFGRNHLDKSTQGTASLSITVQRVKRN